MGTLEGLVPLDLDVRLDRPLPGGAVRIDPAGVRDRGHEAVVDMQRQQRRELERLQALAQVNPNIRREEIDHIEATTRDLEAHLNSARIKLEALRVAVAT